MTRRWIRTAAVGASLTPCLVACGAGPGDAARAGEDTAKRAPLVYVSNEPLRYFAERLAGAGAELRFPAGENRDPADWRPSPEQVVAMQQADLILLNGASYEGWLEDVSLPASRLVDTSAGFRERLIAIEGAVSHSHGPEGAHEHAGTAFTTWLDPTLALEQARSVAAALSARWPDEQPLVEERLARLEADLLALDEALRSAVAAAPERAVLFSHPVYQYLERRYRIDGESVHWEPDAVPEEGEWRRLENRLAQRPARWMLWEGPPLPEVVERLEALEVRSAVFDPCAGPAEAGDFMVVMRRNVEALQQVYATAPALDEP